MTYYGGQDLAAAFRTVRKNTIQIAEEIPEDKYEFKAAPDSRTVRETLIHIALSPAWALHIHANKIVDMKTVNFQELMQTINTEQAKSRTKADIVSLLTSEGETFASFLEGLPESFLAEQVTMMPGFGPPTKTRFELLLGAKEHEMHHRAQLMVIERMIGIVPHLTRQFQERMSRMQAEQPQQ